MSFPTGGHFNPSIRVGSAATSSGLFLFYQFNLKDMTANSYSLPLLPTDCRWPFHTSIFLYEKQLKQLMMMVDCTLWLYIWSVRETQINLDVVFFFGLNPVSPPIQDKAPHTQLAPKSHLVSGQEVIFLKVEWPGLEPRTSRIRRGCSIHSTTPHLA